MKTAFFTVLWCLVFLFLLTMVAAAARRLWRAFHEGDRRMDPWPKRAKDAPKTDQKAPYKISGDLPK